jgi:exodeoxyribonuclease V alpha subunit
MEMIGALQRIIFRNDESGFLIGSFAPDYGPAFSAKGSMLNPVEGMMYKLSGEMENSKYGNQLKFTQYETVEPSDTTGIYKYIVRVCKFVGPTIGNALVDKYGADTLQILREHPEKIAEEIKGLNLEKALKIQTTLKENQATEKLMVEIESLLSDITGIPKSLPGRIMMVHQSNAPAIIKTKPYTLTQFEGIGFIIADRIALKNGFDPMGIERRKAAAIHCIYETMRSEGSVWIPETILIKKIADLISVPDIKAALISLEQENMLTSIPFKDGALVSSLWAVERYNRYENMITRKVSDFLGI